MPDDSYGDSATKGEGLSQKLIYQPPAPTLIDRFASIVCNAMAENGDVSIADPDVVSGFSNFMKLIAKVRSKELNGEIGAVIDKQKQER